MKSNVFPELKTQREINREINREVFLRRVLRWFL